MVVVVVELYECVLIQDKILADVLVWWENNVVRLLLVSVVVVQQIQMGQLPGSQREQGGWSDCICSFEQGKGGMRVWMRMYQLIELDQTAAR